MYLVMVVLVVYRRVDDPPVVGALRPPKVVEPWL